MSSRTLIPGCAAALVALVALVAGGCRINPQVDPKSIPVARATITGDGVEQVLDDEVPVPGEFTALYTGSPLTITLDGTESDDEDGNLETFRWLSSTLDPDDDMGRWMPPDTAPGWPDDAATTTVTLDQGVWSFSLWVIDDEGLTSDPATVTITIAPEGGLMEPEPMMDGDAVQECIDGAWDGISDTCKECTCNVSADCQAAIPNCDEDCWALIRCVGTTCAGDMACVGEMCMEWFGAATPAMAAGTPCVTPCSDMCAPE